MDKTTGREFASWLKCILDETMVGSGIRPSVAFKTEKIVVSLDLPLEWRYYQAFYAETITLDQLDAFTRQAKLFSETIWVDDLSTNINYGDILSFTGRFEFYSEKTPEILYKITRTLLEGIFGQNNISICVGEDRLVVRTKYWKYNLYYDKYPGILREAIESMKQFMRKPIRYNYLRELRNNTNNEEHKN